ncbi:MAG TPA: SDR family oxidoreductase [Opitutaceae bacterium]
MNAYTDARETVLITGATSGIGRELAREFASHGHSLVIVAPVEAEAVTVARQIGAEFGVPARAIARDLRRAGAAGDIFAELTAAGIRVDILCNNAGVGQRGKFWEIPLDRDVAMIRLNVEAVIRMTKRFLPPMLRRGQGRVLNTASIAAFAPGPMLAVYHATKAFVLSWSEALATELQGTGVTVTALCPGPVDTDFFPKADLTTTNIFQKGPVMTPQQVAGSAYEALMRADRVIVPGATNKALVYGSRLLPEAAQAKINEMMYQDAPADEQTRERGDVETKEAGIPTD